MTWGSSGEEEYETEIPIEGVGSREVEVKAFNLDWRDKSYIPVPSGIEGVDGFVHRRRPPEPGQTAKTKGGRARTKRKFDFLYQAFPVNVGEEIEKASRMRYFTAIADKNWTSGHPIPMGVMVHLPDPPADLNVSYGSIIFMGMLYDMETAKWFTILYCPELYVSIVFYLLLSISSLYTPAQ